MGLKIGPPCRIASPARPGLGEKLPLATGAVNGEFFGLFEASGEVAVPGNDGVMLCGAHGVPFGHEKSRPCRGRLCVFECPRALSRGTLTFTSRGLLSVTGAGGP